MQLPVELTEFLIVLAILASIIYRSRSMEKLGELPVESLLMLELTSTVLKVIAIAEDNRQNLARKDTPTDLADTVLVWIGLIEVD